MLDNHTSKRTVDWRTFVVSSVQVLRTRHLGYFIHIIFRHLNENSWCCFWLLQIFRCNWLIELSELFERFFFRNLLVSFHFWIRTRKLKSPKWEIDHTETYFHQSKNPRMESLVIMNCFVWHSRFFDLSLFGGFKNFRDVGTSRWAILPPSDLLSFIDFLFHHSQIYLFQFNEILSMNVQ